MSEAGFVGSPDIEVLLGDPFAKVLALGDKDRGRLLVSTMLSVVFYAGSLYGFAEAYGDGHRAKVLKIVQQLEVPIEPPPPPPPPPEPPPEPESRKDPPPRAAAPKEATPPPPAEAGKVLTADPDPDAPVDLTGEGFVQGTGDTFVGGVTSSSGTSKKAVYDPRAGTVSGPPAARPAAMTGSGPDLSRQPTPRSGSWDHCGFPAEADIEQINYARASVAVTVAADGHAQSAAIVQDPGNGFGALARRCALREHFQPGLSREGHPISKTVLVTITFKR